MMANPNPVIACKAEAKKTIIAVNTHSYILIPQLCGYMISRQLPNYSRFFAC